MNRALPCPSKPPCIDHSWSCHLPYGTSILRSDILTVVLLKLLIPWDVVSCRLVLRYQQSGGLHCPYLQGSPLYLDFLEMELANTNLYKIISQNTRIFSFFPIKCHWVTYESLIQDMGYTMQIFNWNRIGRLKMYEIFWCDVLWLACESLAWRVTLPTSRVVLNPAKLNPWETWSALCQ
jgi:hypothetical protein